MLDDLRTAADLIRLAYVLGQMVKVFELASIEARINALEAKPMSRNLVARIDRLECIAADRHSPCRAAQARKALLDVLDKIGLDTALDRLERRATAPQSVALRDALRRVLEVSHAQH